MTWQAAAVALLAAGIGAGFLPIGSLLGPGRAPGPREPDGPPGQPRQTSLGGGAVLNLAANLKRLAGEREIPPPQPPPPPETSGPTEPQPAPPPPAVGQSDWTYIGHMIGPSFKRAIVQIGVPGGGTPQMALGEGDVREGTTLVKIAPDHIMVDPGDGNQRRIDLASRTASASWNTDPPRRGMSARPPVPGAGMAGMAGFNNPNAAALAEAQRRMRAAMAQPQPFTPPQPAADDRSLKLLEMAKSMGEIGKDKRDALEKIMYDPEMKGPEREALLREMGIPVDATPEERGQFLEQIGIGPHNDPKLYELLRQGSGGGE